MVQAARPAFSFVFQSNVGFFRRKKSGFVGNQ